MPPKPHILHLASWYPGRKDPRLGNFIQRHAEVIAGRCSSALLYAEPAEAASVELKWHGSLREVRVYYRKKLPWISYRRALYRGLQALRREGFQPDLLHLHVAFPAGLWALEQRLPMVISEHHSGYHTPDQWPTWERFIRRAILNKAAFICPVSDHLGEALRYFGAARPQKTIGNVVDDRLFHPPKGSRPAGRMRLMHLSSLADQWKNIRGLLRAVAQLYQRRRDFELWLGGDGNLEQVKRWAAEAQLPEEAWRCFGPLKPQEVAAMMRKCDGFVLFSHTENQPVVLLEAMSTGLPIVSSDVGGIPEFVDEKAGQLVAAGDEAALAEALAQWLEKGPVCPRESHPAVASLASEEDVGASFERLYQQVLAPEMGAG